MNIAILGGSGKLGLALAKRLSQAGRAAAIGSRDPQKAVQAAAEAGAGVLGTTLADAAGWCDLAIASVPYAAHRATLESLAAALSGKILIDAAVPLDPSNRLQVKSETGSSAAEEAAAILPGATVYAAFQTVSHHALQQAGRTVDVLVAGPDVRKHEVLDLIRSIGLNPIDAGPLSVAGHIERMTPLLISINKQNRAKDAALRVEWPLSERPSQPLRGG